MLFVEVQVRFRVAIGAEGVAVALELAPELRVVVDLAVLDDDARAVLAGDRLIASGEVDDREPPRRERDRPIDVLTRAVGTAVEERGAHGSETVGIR